MLRTMGRGGPRGPRTAGCGRWLTRPSEPPVRACWASGSDEQFRDRIARQPELVAEIDDPAGEVAFEPVRDEPGVRVHSVRTGERPCVAELRGRVGQPVAYPIGVASSNIVLALEPFGTGDLTIAKERFDSAIPVLQQRDRSKHAVDACCFRGVIHSHRLEHREANLDFGWAYERALELGLNFELLIALFHRARTRANEGRLYEAAELLNEAERLADLVGERFWRPRIANTQGWLLTELFDTASALRLNTEAAHMAQEFGDVEAECMSHINAARNYLLLDEPDRAAEHLRAANGLYERDVWFRWIYYPRMQAEWASYWITRGDLTQALSHARISLAHAERTQSRKRIAWAHKLLGDIAALEDRPGEADREFKAALHLLERHSCPIIEWQILVPAAAAADMLGERAERDELLGRARHVVHMLAGSLHDDKRQGTFLNSKPIRELLH